MSISSASTFSQRLAALDSMTKTTDMETTIDPDAQATVTDFLDYTEHLPADIIRSLTLIRGLDQTYSKHAHQVHELTRRYGALPTIPAASRPDPQSLRTSISRHLDLALHARQASHAEALRLSDTTSRHYNRMGSIVKKLHALPKPPSRGPTPPPAPTSTKRARGGRKVDAQPGRRLTLNPPRKPIAGNDQKRNRRVTIPGDVLPVFNPDSPIASTEQSDWEEDKEVTKVPKPAAVPKIKKLKLPNIPLLSDEPIIPLKMPPPPPDSAVLGSEHKPWTRLSEWEMWKLRKKMKKNNRWEPSDIMVQRELSDKGRGWENYQKAKAEAKAKGTELVDFDSSQKVEKNVPKPESQETPSVRNRGMKLNEAKKLKKETLAREQAQQAAAETEAAARRLGDLGSAMKNLFSPALPSPRPLDSPTINGKAASRRGQKRKRTASVAQSPSIDPALPKRPKAAAVPPSNAIVNGRVETSKVPLKPSAPAVSSISTPALAAATRTTTIPHSTPPTPPLLSRPPSRARRSLEPSSLSISQSTTRAVPTTRRHSAASKPPSPKAPTQTAASRRPKRDAPGPLTQNSSDGGAAVATSKRRNKPGPKPKTPATQASTTASSVSTPTTTTAPTTAQIRVDIDGRRELIDPDEERYCVCGDVSWGEMICCEMEEDCLDGVWFHLGCVGMKELPARTRKWYSPACRRRWRKGETTAGLVGPVGGGRK